MYDLIKVFEHLNKFDRNIAVMVIAIYPMFFAKKQRVDGLEAKARKLFYKQNEAEFEAAFDIAKFLFEHPNELALWSFKCPHCFGTHWATSYTGSGFIKNAIGVCAGHDGKEGCGYSWKRISDPFVFTAVNETQKRPLSALLNQLAISLPDLGAKERKND